LLSAVDARFENSIGLALAMFALREQLALTAPAGTVFETV